MANKILLLPDHVANQIAAGEIIYRPASVVKELLENAIDAESSCIKLLVRDGGHTLIQVVDDGCGMGELDARMCFDRHATSKIKNAEDLFTIQSLGFRGEALAAIAAVSQVSLSTREQGEELGTCIAVVGSRIESQRPVATQVGTSICVRNLFFNTPARRNFLKPPVVENKYIIETFQTIALAHPHIAFELYRDDTTIYTLRAESLAQRIIDVFGKNYQNKLLRCEAKTELIEIKGYIAPPKEAKKTRGEQFFFINNRFIKSTYLNHAVKQAFENLIPPKTFPCYLLNIYLPTEHVDINVHPTKTEVKVQEERLLYGIIVSTIKKTLAVYHVTPTLDHEAIQAYSSLQLNSSATELSRKEKRYVSFRKDQESVVRNDTSDTVDKSDKKYEEETSFFIKLNSHLNKNQLLIDRQKDALEALTNKFHLHEKYIVAQVKSGMLIIDHTHALERIVYEKILDQKKVSTVTIQQLLLPVALHLQPADFALLKAYEKEILALGFHFTTTPPNKLTITGIPSEATSQDIKALVENLLEEYKKHKQLKGIPADKKWARSMAKHISQKKQDELSSQEIQGIIDQLFASSNPNYTPEGKRIWTIIKLEDIGKLIASSHS